MVILDKVMRIEEVGEGRYDIGVAFTAVDSDHRLALKKCFEKNEKGVMAAHMAWMKDPILITSTNKEKKTKNDHDVAGYFLRFQGFKVRVG